jgi:uncharacterized protein YigE (DUF2233 family)
MIQVFRFLAATLLCLVLTAGLALAEPCRTVRFESSNYTVCSFDLNTTDLRIFWRKADGTPFGGFSALAEDLRARGLALKFATNGGMYDEELSPVGLYIEDGRELRPANTADASGNFHMKPNGVFYVDRTEAGVMETGRFLKAHPSAQFATQSGPMLVIDGKLHPRFIAGSDSRKRRNGVGVSRPHEVHFVLSDGPVSFDEFARLFRDELGCKNALFLDGTISGLYAPELHRNDSWYRFGPIIGVVEKGSG